MNIDIPDEHFDFGKFQNDEIWVEKQFDLIFCDGQVFRNHCQIMTKHRQRCEARRLICSQLLIALRHVRVGGSMMILLHKIDSWDTVLTLRAFDQFASIVLFKPLAAHKAKGSFYFVVKNVQPHHKNALRAVQDWIKVWKDVTFRTWTSEGREDAFSGNRSDSTALSQQVTKVMDEFGERLIILRENAWKIQKETWVREHLPRMVFQACQANSRTPQEYWIALGITRLGPKTVF